MFVVATITMGVGYSALHGVLFEINGNAIAMVTNTLEITSVSVSSSNNVTLTNCSVNGFYHTILNTTVELGNNSDASITYAVTIYNNTGAAIAYKDATPPYTDQSAFYDNTGIKYEVTGISVGEYIQNHASKTFYVTFSYANGVSQNKVLNSIISFNFDLYYTVSYTNFNGTNLPTMVFTTDNNLNVTSTDSPLPSSVNVTGSYTSANYNNTTGVLLVSNITSNITVTGTTSGSGNGGTWDTPVEDNTTSSYNPANVEEGTTQYNNVTGKPRVTADANGNIIQFAFTDPGTNGVAIDGNYNTGVLAFDGVGFEVTLKATFTFANCTKTICPIINISQKKNNKVNGVLVYESRGTSGYAHNDSGSNVSQPYNKSRFGKYLNSSATGSDDYNVKSKVNATVGNGRYGYNSSSSPITLTYKVTCARNGTDTIFTSKILNSSGTEVALPHANMSITFSESDVGANFDGITVQLGHFDASTSGVSYAHKFSVLEFEVKKTTN